MSVPLRFKIMIRPDIMLEKAFTFNALIIVIMLSSAGFKAPIPEEKIKMSIVES